MKNYFLLSILVIYLISLKSCRDQDIYSDNKTIINKQKKQRSKSRDSINIPLKPKQNDPDPPIKDGQDWFTNP